MNRPCVRIAVAALAIVALFAATIAVAVITSRLGLARGGRQRPGAGSDAALSRDARAELGQVGLMWIRRIVVGDVQPFGPLADAVRGPDQTP